MTHTRRTPVERGFRQRPSHENLTVTVLGSPCVDSPPAPIHGALRQPRLVGLIASRLGQRAPHVHCLTAAHEAATTTTPFRPAASTGDRLGRSTGNNQPLTELVDFPTLNNRTLARSTPQLHRQERGT